MLNPKYSTYNITLFSSTNLISIAKLINSHFELKSDICVKNEGLNLEYSGDNAD